MPFDFSKIAPKKEEPALIDPIALFRSLKIRDSAINDLWLGQAEALQPWHTNRDEKDIAVTLNTGAGKTLVGLLIAQSLVNETRGKVIYACNSIQLVEQTKEKAQGYGLNATTYFRGQFSDNQFTQGKAPCITTYQALFNGKSRFANQEISAIIFDDAHTAENVLREQFSLHIKHSTLKETYNALCAEFRGYFYDRGFASTFEEIAQESSPRLLLVPPFEIRKRFSAIHKILIEANLGETQDTQFAWEHLKDKLDLCCFILDAGAVTITPPFIPVRTLPYFQGESRRVYLSATLEASDAFARTFGRRPSKIIAPDSPAGACERLIISPILHEETTDDLTSTIQLIAPRKALIMVPTYRRAARWATIAAPPSQAEMTGAVNSFKSNNAPVKLILTARYDGVDLPGDTCRLMVIDDLPSATGPIERFMWEYLRMSKTLRTTIASRIVQSFGRISRGMSDYGVVILTGKSLVDWLSTPANLEALPPFLQKQLQLGSQISETLPPAEISETIDRCLARDESWVSTYENFIDNATTLSESRDTSQETDLAISEAKFASAIWARDYTGAAAQLSNTLNIAHQLSANSAAWHQYWIAMATDLAGDSSKAIELYRVAHGAQTNLPAPDFENAGEELAGCSDQAKTAALQFAIASSTTVSIPPRMDRELSPLSLGGTSSQVEEAIRNLGIFLGLSSSRPDNEENTGPDNLWVYEDTAFCIDAKTDKKLTSVYRKEELGQMADHLQWVRDNYEVSHIYQILIGPVVPASQDANPTEHILVH